MLHCIIQTPKDTAVIVYTAKVCHGCSDPEPIRLIALSDEPGFGYETVDGTVLVKGRSMAEATEHLLQRFGNLQEVDDKPYWQQSAQIS